VKIGRAPAIRVLRRHDNRDAIVHLDPVYGNVNHRASEPCEDGTLAEYLCPRCRARLGVPEDRCEECGAPSFGVTNAAGERIEWCTRKGCHWTRWAACEARGPATLVELSVEDTGHGIAESDLDHLFEPFFTTKGNRGLGLGLAVTWGIIEGHGGSIDVESEPGRGTCFTVRLPLAPRGAVATVPVALATSAGPVSVANPISAASGGRAS
jgi:hypothetical protein